MEDSHLWLYFASPMLHTFSLRILFFLPRQKKINESETIKTNKQTNHIEEVRKKPRGRSTNLNGVIASRIKYHFTK